jgi:hypothetical protein
MLLQQLEDMPGQMEELLRSPEELVRELEALQKAAETGELQGPKPLAGNTEEFLVQQVRFGDLCT